jgi:large subunit ribosomal protein L13|tara:strand:+ start:663 stop:1094 length:432 start_codon:yes stop_codon:yes gene_type:complete
VKIIDANDLIIGRLATVVVKYLLQGEKVIVVNVEEGVISGSKSSTFDKYLHRRQRKSLVNPARHGPFFPRRPEGILKRAIRGMLPYKKSRGRAAYKNLRVYVGVPKEFEDKRCDTVVDANISKLKVPKYIKLKELSKSLGATF